MHKGSFEDVQIVKLLSIPDSTGKLVIAESGVQLPIEFKRMFLVFGEDNVTRGKHAHKNLTQVFICVSGVCNVACDNGSERQQFALDTAEKALLVPPGIWAEQTYSQPGTTLVVLCDRGYDEDDYIRDYDAFLEYRK